MVIDSYFVKKTMARFEQRAFEVVNRKFEEQLPENDFNHIRTFEKVMDEIEEKAEFRVYSDYNSFKNARSRNRKRKN